jgi:hypoxanthine phosphoribosyltransferase
MTAKEFIDAETLFRESFILARMIHDSGYRPDVLLVLWRGGAPVGLVIHEFLRFKGVEPVHAVIKAESYSGIEKRTALSIEHLDHVMPLIVKGARVLLVDDIFDTGSTVRAVCGLLERKTDEIRTAALYCRPAHHGSAIRPDYFVRETDKWVVFPHEVMDLTPEEIGSKKGGYLRDILGI